MISPLPLSLYLHLPWCVQKCPYCDFNSHAAPAGEALKPLQERYVDALLADIALQAPFAVGRDITSIFIGGGTPSLFSPAQIAKILSRCRQQFGFGDDIEITMEANPGTLEHGSFAGYRSAGVNRLSIGGQSFSPDQLKRLGRLHGPEETRTAAANARAAGFERINIDLMYGLPGQNVAAAVSDVAQAIALDVTHISHYQLTLEPNTRFHANPPSLPEDDIIGAMLNETQLLLDDAGFERYEISALGRDGHRCEHNLNYWQFGDYLAIGAGAHGKLTDALGVQRYTRPAHPRSYIDALSGADAAVEFSPVEGAERTFEFMLNAFRLCGGFTLSLYEERTGLQRSQVAAELARARDRGLLCSDDDEHWAPTPLGMRFNNELQMLFLPG